MKYCLLNIAYDDSFFGFQIQPDLKTVQGEVLKALSPIGVRKVYGSSRTDSHVRSASSIIEVQHDDLNKVCRIVDSIRGIAVRGYYEADEFVNLRKTVEKEYIYYSDRTLSRGSLQRTVREFLRGRLESFSRDPSKKVVLSEISFSLSKTHSILRFTGKSFSWNFVRIAAETIIKRSEGVILDDDWAKMLAGNERSRYKGNAHNLILYRTKAPFMFDPYESRNLNVLRSRALQDFYWLYGLDEGLADVVRSLDFIDKSRSRTKR